MIPNYRVSDNRISHSKTKTVCYAVARGFCFMALSYKSNHFVRYKNIDIANKRFSIKMTQRLIFLVGYYIIIG